MKWCLFLSSFVLVACAQGESTEPASRARGSDVRESDDPGSERGGVEIVDAGSLSRRVSPADDAGPARTRTDVSEAGADAEDKPRASEAAARDQDAGVPDAAPSDNSSEPEPEPGAQLPNEGPCCEAGAGPGCNDPEVQACVCALSPRCCSESWDDSCARLVKEKHCQSGVRDCVCGNGEGQWQQAYCCEGGWNATCESVSIHKCGATEACP